MATHASNEYHYVQLRVRHVQCYEETGIDWVGSDDIAVGGVAIYHDFSTKTFYKNIGTFNTGYNKDRSIKLFGMSMWGGSKEKVSTPLGDVHPFYHNPGKSGIPKYFGAVVFMAETDLAGFNTWIKYVLHSKVKEKAADVKRTILANLNSGQIPDVDRIADTIKDGFTDGEKIGLGLSALLLPSFMVGIAFADSIFKPDTPFISTHTNSYERFPSNISGDANTNTENRTRHFKLPEIGLKNAHYRLELDWKMYK